MNFSTSNTIAIAASPTDGDETARVQGHCYHCDTPLQEDTGTNPFCCPGCAAAARYIEAAGYADYYRLRRTLPQRPVADADPVALSPDAELLHALTIDVGAGARELALEIPGMACAACAWLLESALARGNSVVAIADLAARQLRLRFDPTRVALAGLLELPARLGFPATPIAPDRRERHASRLRQRELLGVGVAGLGAMQSMMFAAARYLDGGNQLSVLETQLLGVSEALIASASLAYAAGPLLWNGVGRPLWQRDLACIGIDTPLATGIALGWLWSLAQVFGGGAVYFDAITSIVFLTLASRYLEARLRRRPIIGLAARPFARRRRDGRCERVPAHSLGIGDSIELAVGDIVPADAELSIGNLQCDEALLTGEQTPVSVAPGGNLYAGSRVVDGFGQARVQATFAASRVSRLQASAEAAASSRMSISQPLDRLGRWYAAAMLTIACAGYAGWWWVEPGRAAEVALAVLVIGCPCALAVALPATIAATNAALMRCGALVTSVEAFERIGRIDTVLFDKTGTLTRTTTSDNAPHVTLLDEPADDDVTVLRIAAALERHASHPYAVWLASTVDRAAPASEFVASDVVVERDGVTGRIRGSDYRVGSAAYVGARDVITADPTPTIWLAREGVVIARIVVPTELQPGAQAAISTLRRGGYAVGILSGDRSSAVAALAALLGIDDLRGEVSPEGKVAEVTRRQSAGHGILLVGDGSNDAPALASADIGVAVAPATATACAGASVRLLRRDLRVVPVVVQVLLRGRAVIRANLRWALFYNFAALPLALAGLVTPLIAAFGMSVSTLLVAGNALRAARLPTDHAELTAPSPAWRGSVAPSVGSL